MEDEQVVNEGSGFVPAIPKGSHMNCPLKRGMCDGRTCAFWLKPENSELKFINRMCLFRLALKKIAGE